MIFSIIRNTGRNVTLKKGVFRYFIIRRKCLFQERKEKCVGKHTVAWFGVNCFNTSAIVSGKIPLLTSEKLDSILHEHDMLKQKIEHASPHTKANAKTAALESAIGVAKKMRDLLQDITEVDKLAEGSAHDEEMMELAKSERKALQEKFSRLQRQFLEALVPEEPFDASDVVLEVMAGVGGQEAMLFTKEMFDMYINYANFKGWDTELYNYEESDVGGLRHASIGISGRQVCHHLKYEGGVHRVQRVPKTEKAGRIHTSTMTVAVLPRPTEIKLKIQQKDLKIETKRSSGAGGQHVNTTDSAVRMTHIPTGIVVECQMERSQIQNRVLAMKKLQVLLFQRQLEQQMATTQSRRKSQIGTSGRSEKIRTYNFNQDRITDHRFSLSFHNMEEIFSGGSSLDEMICQLQEAEQEEKLEDLVHGLGAFTK